VIGRRSRIKGRFACALALCSSLLCACDAKAQWQFALGTGLRQARITETDPAGRTLVREQGLLPGLIGSASYTLDGWLLAGRAEVFARGLDYHGQLQSGAAFTSTTDTRLQRYSATLTRPLGSAGSLQGGLEWDRWQRRIRGRDAISGLTEHYGSWRLLAGAQMPLMQHPLASLDGSAVLVLAQPEWLRVGFDQQLYDEANLNTRWARGLRLALTLQPASLAGLSVTAELDTLTIGRSEAVTLLKNGAPAGSVLQPRHARRAFELRAAYAF